MLKLNFVWGKVCGDPLLTNAYFCINCLIVLIFGVILAVRYFLFQGMDLGVPSQKIFGEVLILPCKETFHVQNL